MVYRSKISPRTITMLIVGFGALSVPYIINHTWWALNLNLLIAGFVAYLLATTYYIINATQLIVRSGFLVNTTIDIASITAVAHTNTIMSAPALSLDRIEVFYNKYDSVVISPPDKTAFVAALMTINNRIDDRLK